MRGGTRIIGATRRGCKRLGLQLADITARAGIPAESLSRFERGRSTGLGSRKLRAVLAARAQRVRRLLDPRVDALGEVTATTFTDSPPASP